MWPKLHRGSHVLSLADGEHLQKGLDISLGTEPAYPENYAMGDFLKFREFLETSWATSDAREAIEAFDRCDCLRVSVRNV